VKKNFVVMTRDGDKEHAYFFKAVDKTQAKRLFYQKRKRKKSNEFIIGVRELDGQK